MWTANEIVGKTSERDTRISKIQVWGEFKAQKNCWCITAIQVTHFCGDISPKFSSCGKQELKKEVRLDEDAKIVKLGIRIKNCSIVAIDFFRNDGTVASALKKMRLIQIPVTQIEQEIGEDEAIFGIYGNKGSFNQIAAIGFIVGKVKIE